LRAYFNCVQNFVKSIQKLLKMKKCR